ncbi:uncharacterized protein LOC113991862 [Pipra filicauda]|uniref:Uncharacterized protein LOC113991862 n=1 Tax=Pipra filicauda TaxID=649802 RepID=A0A7R5KEN9_9PASS|nr:uncharacterized protein LOC113991862 [Pipra filicauda]
MWKMKKFTNLQPRKWLSSWQRNHKVDNWQAQAAAQEEENTSSAAVAEQVRAAGAESQAAAPQSPRGCGRAVLDTLQRVARATRRRLAVGIRRRGQKPEPQREVEPGMEVATAGTSTAAGSERQDSVLQSPCCPPSPFPSHPEALSGQWAGAAAGAVLPVAESKEGAWSEELSDISSQSEQSQGEERTEQPLSHGGDSNGQELFQEKTKKKSSQVHTIWVKPFYPEVLLDPHTGCQEGPGFPSSVGREVVEEADTDLHSSCPALAGPTDSQPAAAALAGAPEEEEHCTPVAAEAQEAAKTAASPALGEQATAAGPGSQAAALHSPFCSPSPSPIQLQANGLSEQWAAAKAVLPAPEAEEGAFSKLGRDLNVYSPQELPHGERSGDQSWSSREKGFPVPIPCEVLAESWDLQAPTPRARAPVRRSSSPYIRPQAPTPDRCALSPSPCELETLSGQRGGVWSSELWDISRESQGQEHTHQPLSQVEDSNDTELSQDNWEDIEIYTIWVKPSLIPILLEPQTGGQEGPKCPCTICKEAAEQTDGDQHSTAAGAEGQAAALHTSPCPASPSPSQLAALSEQWAVAAVGAFLPVAQTKERAWSKDGSLWDISSLLEPCQEEENTAESWSTGGVTSSVSLPCGPWAEPWDSQEGTSTDDDLGAVRDMGPSNPNQQFYMGTGTDLTEEGLLQPRPRAKKNSQEQKAVRGAICCEDDLLAWDRQSSERCQVEPSSTPVSAQRPSLFREALRALCGAFCWSCLARRDGGSQGVAVTAPTST